MKLVIASNNPGKLREIREIMEGSGIEILSQREAGCDFEAEETGTSFDENARIKALAAMQATGLPAAADDSGLEVNAMHGAPALLRQQNVRRDLSGNHFPGQRLRGPRCAVLLCGRVLFSRRKRDPLLRNDRRAGLAGTARQWGIRI